MKYILNILILIISINAEAKRFNGYVILKNEDTLKCQIIQNFTVISGIDINSFQAGIRVAFDNGKKQDYLPNDIKGFGIYSETDTLHFLPVKIKAYTVFKGMQEKWFLMNIIDRGFIKIYYYIDVMSGTGGSRRVPMYALQLSYSDVGQWLQKAKNDSEKYDYKTFFKAFIPEYSAFFESLPDNAKQEEVIEKVIKFNKAMIK